MNILIMQQSLGLGGVNMVSAKLAVKFKQEGHAVDIFAFYKGKDDMPRSRYQDIPIHIGHGWVDNKKNVALVKKIIESRHINLVINQWGLPYTPTATLRKACKELKVKWISFYHNDPLYNGKISSLKDSFQKSTNIFKKMGLWLALKIMTFITGRMMRLNYHFCWRFMILSESYISHFLKFTRLDQAERLRVMYNPVTIETGDFQLLPNKKQKKVIYVGRLDPVQKHVSRLVETWCLIEKKCPDWSFTIVGDGLEKEALLHRINELQLENVKLVGNQDPRSFYEQASILVLSSDFEGFPLVLGECMSFGVIPVIYDSFSALHDIVEDGVNGVIVPKENGEFSAKLMANKMSAVINDETLRKSMMINAQKKSIDFHIDTIYKKWEEIFNEYEEENRLS